jgi:hypothetical protein
VRLDAEERCERCDGDLRLYAALCESAVSLYDQARRAVDASDPAAASALLEVALQVAARLAEWRLVVGGARSAADLFDRAEEPLAREGPNGSGAHAPCGR